jgi:hypothetical protein
MTNVAPITITTSDESSAAASSSSTSSRRRLSEEQLILANSLTVAQDINSINQVPRISARIGDYRGTEEISMDPSVISEVVQVTCLDWNQLEIKNLGIMGGSLFGSSLMDVFESKYFNADLLRQKDMQFNIVKSSKPGNKKKDRKVYVYGSEVFLTYSRCPIPKEDLVYYLRILLAPAEIVGYIVGSENHEDQAPHLHAYVRFKESMNFHHNEAFNITFNEHSTTTDLNGHQVTLTNRSVTFKANFAAVTHHRDRLISYVKKDGNFIEDFSSMERDPLPYAQIVSDSRNKKVTTYLPSHLSVRRVGANVNNAQMVYPWNQGQRVGQIGMPMSISQHIEISSEQWYRLRYFHYLNCGYDTFLYNYIKWLRKYIAVNMTSTWVFRKNITFTFFGNPVDPGFRKTNERKLLFPSTTWITKCKMTRPTSNTSLLWDLTGPGLVNPFNYRCFREGPYHDDANHPDEGCDENCAVYGVCYSQRLPMEVIRRIVYYLARVDNTGDGGFMRNSSPDYDEYTYRILADAQEIFDRSNRIENVDLISRISCMWQYF